MTHTAAVDRHHDVEQLIEGALQDDQENGVYRCRRDIFTDPDLFELFVACGAWRDDAAAGGEAATAASAMQPPGAH